MATKPKDSLLTIRVGAKEAPAEAGYHAEAQSALRALHFENADVYVISGIVGVCF